MKTTKKKWQSWGHYATNCQRNPLSCDECSAGTNGPVTSCDMTNRHMTSGPYPTWRTRMVILSCGDCSLGLDKPGWAPRRQGSSGKGGNGKGGDENFQAPLSYVGKVENWDTTAGHRHIRASYSALKRFVRSMGVPWLAVVSRRKLRNLRKRWCVNKPLLRCKSPRHPCFELFDDSRRKQT